MNGRPYFEPQLGPDFAARVLEMADRIVERRRRVRGMAVAAVLFGGIAGTAIWLSGSMTSEGPPQGRNPVLASASSTNGYGDTSAKAQTDNAPNALSWFFPDAQPLARYASDDSYDDSGDAAATLFSDDE